MKRDGAIDGACADDGARKASGGSTIAVPGCIHVRPSPAGGPTVTSEDPP